MLLAGGIRVGASVSILEDHFKGLLNRDLGDETQEEYGVSAKGYMNELPSGGSGEIGFISSVESFSIEFKNGKITSISRSMTPHYSLQ